MGAVSCQERLEAIISSDPKIIKIIGDSLLRGMIAEGVFGPRGLSQKEIQIQLRKECLRRLKSNEESIVWSTMDRTSTLTREARRFQSQGFYEIAVLLYATASEHWLNVVVSALCKRSRLGRSGTPHVIRDTPFRAKCTWLLTLLDAPPIKTCASQEPRAPNATSERIRPFQMEERPSGYGRARLGRQVPVRLGTNLKLPKAL